MGYFIDLMSSNDEVSESIRPLLKLSQETIVRSQKLDYALEFAGTRSAARRAAGAVEDDPGVGPITALTWLLRSDVSRFQSIKRAISYCELCSAERSSADKLVRMPISKQRNKHIQQVLVEAAKLAPRYNHELALVYEREQQRGNKNKGDVCHSQEMVAYMLAVERRKQNFVLTGEFSGTAAA